MANKILPLDQWQQTGYLLIMLVLVRWLMLLPNAGVLVHCCLELCQIEKFELSKTIHLYMFVLVRAKKRASWLDGNRRISLSGHQRSICVRWRKIVENRNTVRNRRACFEVQRTSMNWHKHKNWECPCRAGSAAKEEKALNRPKVVQNLTYFTLGSPSLLLCSEKRVKRNRKLNSDMQFIKQFLMFKSCVDFECSLSKRPKLWLFLL